MPTPVQRKTLPVVLSGVDTVVMARTGSGKTAAFLIPLVEKLAQLRTSYLAAGTNTKNFSAGGLILSPTRELSTQTLRVLRTLATHTDLTCIGINGGESMENQFTLLSSNPDIIVATPGRLAHHLSEIPDFHLKNAEMLILDEADRLFEMGFAMQIRQICNKLPQSKQTLLFSATMPKVLIEFTKTSDIMSDEPAVVRLDNEATVSEDLRIGFITVRSGEKDAALLHLLRDVLPQVKTSSLSPKDEGNEDEENANDDTIIHSKKMKKTKNGVLLPKLKGGEAARGLTLVFAATRHHTDYLTMLVNRAFPTTGEHMTAACIYGTMDQEARHLNLTKFRSGYSPILIVTDVAARGIDVPLIDHVVHYNFPPAPKLFVHRSGRAARAGRIGYCWGLVDTEEIPYMLDLYVFLGRKVSSGHKEKITDDDEDNRVEYTLDEMTPEMVHYGTVPESIMVEEVENVRRVLDSELSGGHDILALKNMARVCNNAMKQYRKSRPAPSNNAVRRARALLDGDKEQSGQRISKGSVPSHPVLRGIERKKFLSNASSEEEKKIVINKMNQLRKREEFLKAMSNFRPKETVFEAFGTGGGKDAGILSQVDKGRTTNSKTYDSSAGLIAMKRMRRQMKQVRDKGTTLVIAGSHNAQVLNGDIVDNEEVIENSSNKEASTKSGKLGKNQEKNPVIEGKKHMSKAERKRLKKNPNASVQKRQISQGKKKGKQKRGADFRDNAFYMGHDDVVVEENEDSEAAERSRQIEAAMQPSSASGGFGDKSSLLRLEENMLDLVGDEKADLVDRHRIMRWDKSKRKYVQTTIGQELSGDSKSKRMRLESGAYVKSGKLKLGELYEKWQKKTNRSIGRTGVFDDVTMDDAGGNIVGAAEEKAKGAGDERDEKKSLHKIRKEREAVKDKKLKNMKKDVRKKIESKQREERNAKRTAAMSKEPGWQGKKGYSGRNGAIMKRNKTRG